jgi:predicted nucleotidyltransferase
VLRNYPEVLEVSVNDELQTIAFRYGVGALYAFGSRATEVVARVRGQEVLAASDSDVDIGVQPAAGRHLTAQERVRLTMELEDLLNVKRVDVIMLSEADPFLALEVIRGELLYCVDADAQAEDELYILRRAADLAHYARDRWEQLLTGTAP